MRGLHLSRQLLARRGRIASLVAVVGLGIGLVGGCVYNTPQIGHGSSFDAVATISSTDAWAVGSYNDGRQHPHPLIEHFDGRNWTIVAAPTGTGSVVYSITAISASDIWALSDGAVLHWNGHRWGVATDLGSYTLFKVTHTPGGVLMALGFQRPSGATQVLVHGTSGWSPLTTSPLPLPNSHRACDVQAGMSSITALSPADVWVGGSVGDPNAATPPCAYAAHWDGSHWTSPPVPNVTGNDGTSIASISARGPNEVWAVGSDETSGENFRFVSRHGYVVRWNGTSWTKLCNFGCGPDWSTIDATGSAVWVVGETQYPQDPFTPAQMEIDRWAGNGWVPQQVLTPPVTSQTTPVYSLVSASVHGGTVISVGSFYVDNHAAAHGPEPAPLVDVRPDR